MAFDLNEIKQSRNYVDRVDTYNTIQRFEQENQDRLYGQDQEDVGSSSDPNEHLYMRQDQRDYDYHRQRMHSYNQAVQNSTFVMAHLRDAPDQSNATQLEEIIEQVKYENDGKFDQQAFDEKIRRAAKKTVILPIEAIPLELLNARKPPALIQPKRLLRSQLDPIHQASKATEIQRTALDDQMKHLAKRPVYTTKSKDFPPSRDVVERGMRQSANLTNRLTQSHFELQQRKVESRNKVLRETGQIRQRVIESRPKLTQKDYQLAEILRLEKSLSQLNKSCNLIKGYQFLLVDPKAKK